jgi:RHS repeat-associated protein
MRSGTLRIGHPVDVATGTVYSTHSDITIHGRVPLLWDRRYCTAMLTMPSGPLGPGWTSRYFATLTPSEDGFRFVTPEGDLEIFADREAIDRGDTVRNLSSFDELHRQGDTYVVTRWNVIDGNVERYKFRKVFAADVWQLACIEDVTGDGLDLVYDTEGRLATITQRLERRTLLLEYSSATRIGTIAMVLPTDGKQILARYEYDASGALIAAFNARNYGERFQYDVNFRLNQETSRDGGVFSFTYDQQGRCLRVSGLHKYDEKQFRFLDHIRWTEVTNSYGDVVRYQWLPTGQVTTERDAMGGVITTDYDSLGRIVAITAPNNGVTRYEYDERGNRSAVVDARGFRTEFRFNDAHLMVSRTDSNGALWLLDYNSQNRLVRSTEPTGGVSSFEYDGDGNLVRLTRPNGAHRRQMFTGNGRLTQTTDWNGSTTFYRWNGFGLLEDETGPSGDAVHIEYDLCGNPTSMTFPDGTVVSATHDPGDNLATLVEGDGGTTYFRYGTCHRLLKVVDPLGHSTRYRWGSEPSRLDAVINEKGESYTFDYDAAGRLVRETGFDGRELAFEYDAAGNCIAVVNAERERIVYERDLSGNITREILSDGSAATFEYDSAGNLTAALNDACEVRFERNLHGQVTREIQGPHVIEHEYDRLGHLARTHTSLGHDVRFTTDSSGKLAEIVTHQGYAIAFRRDAAGNEVQRLLPGGVDLRQTYEGHRVVEQRLIAGLPAWSNNRPESRAESLVSRQFQYDKAGLLTTVTDAYRGTTRYVYDLAQQLIERSRDGSAEERFGYDAVGNVVEARARGKDNDEYLYGPGNRLLRHGSTAYRYDQQGRVTTKVAHADGQILLEWQFEWDTKDQLRSVILPDGRVWNYVYDALGRRISKSDGENVQRFVWDLDVVVHEIQNNVLESSWIFENHSFRPLCVLRTGEVFSVIADHLGTPQELVDQTGRIAWRADSTSWGSVSRISGADEMPIRFPGQWFDAESGLHYNRFRYYEPETGRYLSQDPIGLLGGFNLYAYGKNPINWVDPFGLARTQVPAWVRRLPAGMDRNTARDTTMRDAMQAAGRSGSTIQMVPDHLLSQSVADVAKAAGDSPEAATAMKLLKQDKDEKSKSKDHC